MRPSKDASVSEARGYAQRPCYRSRRSCAHDHWCTVGVCWDRAVNVDAMRAWGHIGRGLEGKRCVRKHSISLSTAMSRYARLALALLSAIVLACHNDPGGPATRTDPDTGLISFASVRSGLWDTCGIATSGTYCWGLGDSVPSRVRGGMQFYMVEASALNAEHRACGLTSSGAPYCWTPCAYTTAWTYCQPDDSLPVAVPGNHQFSTLTIGGGQLSPDHACGLTGSGAAYCWGDNGYGELGDGTRVGQILGPGGWPTDTAPVAVVGGPRFTTISAGGSRTCGIAVGGDAYCWGLNALLGTDDTTSEFIPVPTPVVGGLKYSTVSLGVGHTCALTLSGAAYCWGPNYDGELGMGDLSIRFQRAPVPVAGQLSFVGLVVVLPTPAKSTVGGGTLRGNWEMATRADQSSVRSKPAARALCELPPRFVFRRSARAETMSVAWPKMASRIAGVETRPENSAMHAQQVVRAVSCRSCHRRPLRLSDRTARRPSKSHGNGKRCCDAGRGERSRLSASAPSFG